MSAAPILIHLSGPRRGESDRLEGDLMRLGAAAEMEIAVSPEPSVAPHHATVRRTGDGYEITAESGQAIWINGERLQQRRLAAGDLLEIGRDGPVLRFRLYPPGSGRWKSVSEAFADGMDGARGGGRRGARWLAGAITGVLRELGTRTTLAFRASVLLLIAVLAVASAFQLSRGRRLERRLDAESSVLQGLAELLEGGRARSLAPEELARVRSELRAAAERLAALEQRSDAPARIVGAAAPSVVLLQGSYGFVDPASGRPLRFAGLGADGLPVTDLFGNPRVGIGGDGPPVEAYLTGTAFVASASGLLITNRHVVLPWEYDSSAQQVVGQGLEPRMGRFIGYRPGEPQPFPVTAVVASEKADVAVLWTPARQLLGPPLPIAAAPARTGDEILVLGYPAGIQALLARADEAFVAELRAGGELDFWQVASRLAEDGRIGPLASRGIVAQVSEAAVVYDAETTRGGSGGPVLDLDGRVVAVTSAVISEFGGSNLGVPAAFGSRLLPAAELLVAPFRLR